MTKLIPRLSGVSLGNELQNFGNQSRSLLGDLFRLWPGLLYVVGSVLFVVVGAPPIASTVITWLHLEVPLIFSDDVWFRGLMTLTLVTWTTIMVGHGLQIGNKTWVYGFYCVLGLIIAATLGVHSVPLIFTGLLMAVPFFVENLFTEQGVYEMNYLGITSLVILGAWIIGFG